MVTITLGSLPTKGVLYRDSKPITVLIPGLEQAQLWVAAVLSFSSEYDNGYNTEYHAERLVGPPRVFSYGDNLEAWCAWNGAGYTSLDPQFTYTDFVEVQFEAKVYPLQLMLVEVWCF